MCCAETSVLEREFGRGSDRNERECEPAELKMRGSVRGSVPVQGIAE